MHSLLLQQRQLSINYKKTYVTLLACYLVLKPFYIFSSGLPQLSDILLMLLVCISIVSFDKTVFRQHSFLLLWGAAFFYYSVLVNFVWAIVVGGDTEIAVSSIFYLFNLIVSVVFIHLCVTIGKPAFMQVVFYATACSVLLQSLLIPFFLQTDGVRSTLMFNNPNQLGYFGLLSFAILLVTAQYVKVRPLFLLFSIIASMALIIVSLSKAAILSGVVMLFLFLILKVKRPEAGKTKWYLIGIIGLLLAVFLINAKLVTGNSVVGEAVFRMDSMGSDNDDSFVGRGYDRMLKHPDYLILGAGEGLFTRFDPLGKSGQYKELHSTLGNILFSYGVVGLLLFAVFVGKILSKLKFTQMYPLVPVLLFGFTHNGIRHTYLWLLLILLYLSKANTDHNSQSDEVQIWKR